MIKKERYPHGGFTLIELLVVVLIIGILAAIALPQYKMAVGKARFSELKAITKSVQEGAQRYYLVNNTYVGASPNKIDIEIPNSIFCAIFNENSIPYVSCGKEIFGIYMGLYVFIETGYPAICKAASTNTNDWANRLCYQETGNSGHCYGDYCEYYYTN